MVGRDLRQANPVAEPGGLRRSGHPWDQDVLQGRFPAVHHRGSHRDDPDIINGEIGDRCRKRNPGRGA